MTVGLSQDVCETPVPPKTAKSCQDHSSRACTQPHAPGLSLLRSLTTISGTLFSRFRIPDFAVTVNWSSVQPSYSVHVQPVTKGSDPLDWDPSPHPRTREHSLHQQLNGLLTHPDDLFHTLKTVKGLLDLVP
jgi:hypothetical protein